MKRNMQSVWAILMIAILSSIGMAVSLIHISEPTRRRDSSGMPSSA